MRLSVGLFALLVACNGCFRNSVSQQGTAASDQVETAFAKYVIEKLSAEQKQAVALEVKRFEGRDGGDTTGLIREAEKKAGVNGVQQLALANGYLVTTPENAGVGLFAIAGRVGDALVARRVLAPLSDEISEQGFAFLLEIGPKLYFVVSDWGLESSDILGQGMDAKLRDDLGQLPLLQSMTRLADLASTGLAQTRAYYECGVPKTTPLRKALLDFAGPTLADYNAYSSATESTAFKVSRLMQAAANNEAACPFFAYNWLGLGLSPATFYHESRVVLGVRLAFLGRMIRGCAPDEGEQINFSVCTFDYLMRVEPAELRTQFVALGKNPSDWVHTLGFFSTVIQQQGPEKQRQLVESLVDVGLTDPPWLVKVGVRFDALPQKVEVRLEREYFDPEGKPVTKTTSESAPIRSGTPFPLVAYALGSSQTIRFDTCKTPIFWKDSWWRVCPQN